MEIKRYNPKSTNKGENIFFIQSHGFNAGRPLKKPIPNSWEIKIENSQAFEICFVVFNSKILNNYLRGSVIPFLSLREYKKIILPYLSAENLAPDLCRKIDSLSKVDLALQDLQKRKTLYNQLKNALSIEILKQLNATF